MRVSVFLCKRASLNWPPCVGLEIHAQICSRDKIFSTGPVGSHDPSPNSSLSLFDVAIPGTMPVINKDCVKAGVLTALALRSRINSRSYFDRKHYFYPDLPGGYQISQNRVPLAVGGYLSVYNNNNQLINVSIKQVQLEQDSGKIVFGEKTIEGHDTLLDYKRAGVGLMEIVTDPVLIDGSSAANFIRELRLLLKRIGTCDGNMADGSLRVDANVSVRETGSDGMGTRTEIKNISGIKFLKKAIDYEIWRHIQVLSKGGVVLPETMRYDERKNVTTPTRGKSSHQDYRFIEEHDLPALLIEREGLVDECRKILEEIPTDNVVESLSLKYGISLYDAQVLESEDWAIDLFEEVMTQCPQLPVKLVISWITSELYGLINDRDGMNVCVGNFMSLLILFNQNELTGPQAKKILRLMVKGDSRSPIDILHDIQTAHYSHTDIVDICETILTEHKEEVSEYISGNDRRRKLLFGFFMGEAMSLTGRDCDPKEIKGILLELLNNKM
ncbi:PREDICTED: uncharacterized protein LOC100631448 [Amphimedon queenslandica]|uniref:Glutamyl-tRNA(Gln) amidotransferase subunit B, mitochondrial n=1 Tax=Amphimedon queenslandica TaxID=400682 RepID=A0A1X7UE62_AMPQE|nr:PREDICTED: uncharacterized protein LOC100631448 [Amphimedon queenslandica]|eukprot:XP_019854939.1 PREDICTED: uncharacterized protein LOC100631448 [Amphimedon queenslandica]